MYIFTTHLCYDGKIGVTGNGEYYDLETGKRLNREYHNGAIYYRCIGSKKRYSWKKCNDTKIAKSVKIIEMPF
jgi:hypothetical protein